MMMIVKISRTNFFAFILVVHQNFVQKHLSRRIKSSARERDDVEIGEKETSRTSSFKRARKLAYKK